MDIQVLTGTAVSGLSPRDGSISTLPLILLQEQNALQLQKGLFVIGKSFFVTLSK